MDAADVLGITADCLGGKNGIDPDAPISELGEKGAALARGIEAMLLERGMTVSLGTYGDMVSALFCSQIRDWREVIYGRCKDT